MQVTVFKMPMPISFLSGSVRMIIISSSQYAVSMGLATPVPNEFAHQLQSQCEMLILCLITQLINFSPAANPHTKIAHEIQNHGFGFQLTRNTLTERNRSKAMPTSVKLLTRIAVVVTNGTTLHRISPRT